MAGGGSPWTTHGSRASPPSIAGTTPGSAANSMSPTADHAMHQPSSAHTIINTLLPASRSVASDYFIHAAMDKQLTESYDLMALYKSVYYYYYC